MKSFTVLLCTYNGEVYLKELLESLLSQTYPEYRIDIYDDGSQDGTVSMLQSFRKEYPERIRIVEGDRDHRGYPDCFWYLLANCDKADYYAFCDQDDVWDPEKLACAAEKLKGAESESGDSVSKGRESAEKDRKSDRGKDGRLSRGDLLYIHDYVNCDADLKELSVHRMLPLESLSFDRVLFYTIASGFSMVINECMRERLLGQNLEGHDILHDEWCIWNAFRFGQILYDTRLLVRYRRHDQSSTVYGKDIGSYVKAYLKTELFGEEFEKKCRRAAFFLEVEDKESSTNSDSLAESNKGFREKPDLSDLEQQVGIFRRDWSLLIGKRRSISGYFKRLFFPKRLRPSLGGEAVLRLLFLTHYRRIE